jgi:hypothetical protein
VGGGDGGSEKDGEVGLREGERKRKKIQECGSGWCLAHFAAALEATAGGAIVASPSPFCASGEGWVSRWSRS